MQLKKEIQDKNLNPIDSSIVEIITRLTNKPAYAIVSEPFSFVIENHTDCMISNLQTSSLKIGDNILVELGINRFDELFINNFTRALRITWIKLIEDSDLLKDRVTDLFCDPEYLKTLNQIGGLYRYYG